jgi:hypothetical protein
VPRNERPTADVNGAQAAVAHESVGRVATNPELASGLTDAE